MDTNLPRSGLSAIVEYDYKAKEPDELDLIKGAIIVNIKKQDIGWWEGTLVSNGKTGMFPDNFVRVLNNNDDDDDRTQVVLRDKSSTIHRRCKVVYSYTQDKDDELSIEVGDVIEILGEVEEGWWRGKIGDKIGVFPSNFVVPLESSPKVTNKRVLSTAATTAPIAAKKPDQQQKSANSSLHSSREDLFSNSSPLSSSSIVLDRDSKDASVLLSSSITGAPLLPPKPIREYCRVLFPYEPKNDDELELQCGEIITILNKELPDKGWWKGELHGKIGVFPDNFVQLLSAEVSPLKDSSSQSDSKPPPGSGSSRMFIKKSGSGGGSINNSNNRKDSFGSRDSLNDILNETGIVSGNVAAQRKSLENKTNLNNDSSSSTSSLSMVTSSHNADGKLMRRSLDTKTSEIRKSLENSDDKKMTTSMTTTTTATTPPPPVLTKKPIVPIKKQTTVTSVAGNILSGIKQKVKSVESKLTASSSSTSLHNDNLDGLCNSKITNNSQIPDNSEKGIVGEKHFNSRKLDESEFDNVERGSMLADMRAGRVKAPKRRPPSAAINIIGEGNNSSNNSNSIYLNGSSGSIGGGVGIGGFNDSNEEHSEVIGINNNLHESGELAKPKPREWERKKAPWMEELKASQAKKTSPNIELQQHSTNDHHHHHHQVTTRSEMNSEKIDREMTRSAVITNNSGANALGGYVSTSTSSSTSSSSNQQQRKLISETTTITSGENKTTNNSSKKDSSSSFITSPKLPPGPSSNLLSSSAEQQQQHFNITTDDTRNRPTSLSIRNQNVSPPIGSGKSIAGVGGLGKSVSVDKVTAAMTTSGAGNTNNVSNNAISQQHVNPDNVCLRVVELEQRILKLEGVVQSQNKIIQELVRTLKDETDKVKLLKSELDKYAQCVTQV